MQLKTSVSAWGVLALAGALAGVLGGCGQPTANNTAGDNASSGNATGNVVDVDKATETNSDAATKQSNAGGKTYLIGMSQANKGEPWRQAMNDQIATAAKAHPELKVVFTDANQDNGKQVADVKSFLQQGIDLLIISPNEAAPLTDVVAEAYDKGIPVILLDRKVNGNKYTMHIGADNVEIGRKAGEFVAKWCATNNRKPGKIIEIRGLEGTSGTIERGSGFRKGIAKANVKIVAQGNGKWTREVAIPVSQAMLQANPDIDVVYGHNDPMAEAAVISAQSAGRDLKKILFVGVDGLPTNDGGLKSVAAGRLGVTYVYPTGGAQAIDWAVKILKDNAKPPRSVVLKTEEVTKANAMQVYKKYGGA